jgi:ABC-type multidrug transport system permease subunit
MNLGALATVYQIVGLLYILGGLLFGIATFRARILSRWAAGLLIVAPLAAPVGALLPGELHRIAAVPMGIALAWLGYALWSERRGQASDPVGGSGSPRVR